MGWEGAATWVRNVRFDDGDEMMGGMYIMGGIELEGDNNYA